MSLLDARSEQCGNLLARRFTAARPGLFALDPAPALPLIDIHTVPPGGHVTPA
ncbi:hypothetical protein ABZ552_10315 [Nocardia sp. NPDC019219]|uniref:hypothetical protein n=1 Tax=Nocardia sp. NPDC019219 TaxID=3154590 RepID=UPI003408199C